jgi:hypothetical protein
VSFDAGTGGAASGADPSAVLGSPTRLTAPTSPFGGAVTPFNPSFGANETFSLGSGGQITVRFDEPVLNDPNNPFGIDLLVFGNSFFYDSINFDPIANELSSEGGIIEVSSDGIAWSLVQNTQADGLWPTLGYSDQTDPFGGPAGNVPTDFTKPVNPSFSWQGKTLAQLVAGYDGSGGGAGIDIGALGLSQISYVRVAYGNGPGASIEIDGFSDVTPIPAPALLLPLAGTFAFMRRRR